jgi:hypothetical protein
MVKRHQRRDSEETIMATGIGENEATIDRLGAPVSVPAGVPAGKRVIARMVAAVGRGVARMAARRRRRADPARAEEFSRSFAAGLSRGLTLFVNDRGSAPRRGPNGR